MGAAFGKKGASSGFYYRQEEVLNDILKDPFARQVFEDIYRQTQKKADAGGEKTERRADPCQKGAFVSQRKAVIRRFAEAGNFHGGSLSSYGQASA